jgi:SAM-dependent MidA family methyltransferase
MTLTADPVLPAPTPEAAAHSRLVGEYIAADILDAGGWIPFSRYVDLALYAPGLGYYAAGARKFGAEGDFVTAPEISPYFGRCVAMQARQVLQAVGGDILELGPGSGALAAEVFAELKAAGAAPRNYFMLEVSPDLRERQHTLLAERHPEDLGRFTWLDTLPMRFRGFVVANEVLDVVPFALAHRAQGGELRERGVILSDAGFAWDDQALGEGELLRRACAVFPPGAYEYLSEVSLPAEALVRSIATVLEAGVALFIDYGFPQREYYHPQRSMGTLRCHYRHRFHGDPFFLPGLQDITAHVDFSAMARAAEQGGAEIEGFTTQAHFLISCGLAVMVAENDPEATLSRLKANSAVHRLIDPSEMGELFKALAIGKGMQGPLLGFQAARPLAL